VPRQMGRPRRGPANHHPRLATRARQEPLPPALPRCTRWPAWRPWASWSGTCSIAAQPGHSGSDIPGTSPSRPAPPGQDSAARAPPIHLGRSTGWLGRRDCLTSDRTSTKRGRPRRQAAQIWRPRPGCEPSCASASRWTPQRGQRAVETRRNTGTRPLSRRIASEGRHRRIMPSERATSHGTPTRRICLPADPHRR